ncbi:endonuclease/exonuclease/phosphatase family protein [Streptomyces ehimensis]|uniref:Endonuclease/exonuclease/phosphatase family protein n=1 Tax=Streptomyces ehimensis TaxID=68195 RepID=A0ABV9BDU7_9ACTN
MALEHEPQGALVQIAVMSQNLGRGGWKRTDGAIEDRWPQLAEAINAVRPDVLLGQEAEGRSADGHARLTRAEHDLDMDGILAPSSSGLGPVTMYRRETMGRRTYLNRDFSAHETHHGFEVVGWTLPCLPAPLTAGSVHLTPYDPVRAASEVSFMGSRVHRAGGGYAILGGDFNFPPVAGPEPAYEQMRPYNRGSRLVVTDPELPGPPEPDRSVAWRIAGKGFVDVAWHLYKESGDENLLTRTSSDERIDWVLVSDALVPCITDYGVIDTGSDHRGIWVKLDLTKAVTSKVWSYR